MQHRVQNLYRGKIQLPIKSYRKIFLVFWKNFLYVNRSFPALLVICYFLIFSLPCPLSDLPSVFTFKFCTRCLKKRVKNHQINLKLSPIDFCRNLLVFRHQKQVKILKNTGDIIFFVLSRKFCTRCLIKHIKIRNQLETYFNWFFGKLPNI